MQTIAFNSCNVLQFQTANMSSYFLEYRILQKYCCKVVTFTRQNDRENYRGFESYEEFIKGNNNAYRKKARHTIGIRHQY